MKIRCTIVWCLLSAIAYGSSPDSSREGKTNYSLLGSLSSSYITYHNWQNADHTTLSFLSNIDYRHRRSIPSGWSHENLFKLELGYLNFADSIWIKNADQFKIAMQWNEKPGKNLTHTYSFFMQSQLLNSFDYDNDNGKTKKGWFMAPGLIEIAYGLHWRFWHQSRINVSFATCRLRSMPRLDNIDEEEYTAKTDNFLIRSEYGFSMQLYINQEFYDKHFLWENQGRFFFNRLSAEGVHMDCSNRFTLRFLKYLQFRIDTHLVYEPDFNTRISYRQELLLGVFFEMRK